MKGWRYAIENPDEAVELTLQVDPTLTRDRQAVMMATQTPLIHTGEHQIGWMRAEVWRGMQDTLLEQGILDAPVDLDKAYTLRFLHTVYEVDASTP